MHLPLGNRQGEMKKNPNIIVGDDAPHRDIWEHLKELAYDTAEADNGVNGKLSVQGMKAFPPRSFLPGFGAVSHAKLKRINTYNIFSFIFTESLVRYSLY